MLLKAIKFENYRAFQSTVLPLEPLTLLIGPNGSGKTSALSAIATMADIERGRVIDLSEFLPIGLSSAGKVSVALTAVWEDGASTTFNTTAGSLGKPRIRLDEDPLGDARSGYLSSGRVFNLDPKEIAAAVLLEKRLHIEGNGGCLPAVLTTLQDQFPERFTALNDDLRRWLPEFDRILFDTPAQGQRAIELRTAEGGHSVPTRKLSHGTLLSLTLLTLCHLPSPPSIIGLEEPDHGLHPRLLRDLKDSLLRLTSPQSFGDKREPVQVIMTTHSPYMVDLFRDEPESIVLTIKEGLHSTFRKLSDLPHVEEIIGDSSLGEAWYSGVLGGVPVRV